MYKPLNNRPSDVPHHIWATDLRQLEIQISHRLLFAWIPFELPRAERTNSTVSSHIGFFIRNLDEVIELKVS